MTLKDYTIAKEEELINLRDPDNEFIIESRISEILQELQDAVKYWLKRYEEGGIADTRLDRFDAVFNYDVAEDWDR